MLGEMGRKLLASALLLPQTDLGGDLYSNRRRELIDAMTALPCLKAAVFSGRVEGLSFYDSCIVAFAPAVFFL